MLEHIENKNRIRDFLIDFVNYATISESVNSLFRFLQQVYSFSDDFHVRMSRLFCPTKKSNTPENIIEKEQRYAPPLPDVVVEVGDDRVLSGEKALSIERFHKLLLDGYRNLRTVKLQLRGVLRKVAKQESLVGNESIKRIVDIYEMNQDTMWFVKSIGIDSHGWPYSVVKFEEMDFLQTSLLHPDKHFSGIKWGHQYELLLYESFFILFQSEEYLSQISLCNHCEKLYVKKTSHVRKYCSDKCRMDSNNARRIASGEHARYKRERKKQGKATVGYY